MTIKDFFYGPRITERAGQWLVAPLEVDLDDLRNLQERMTAEFGRDAVFLINQEYRRGPHPDPRQVTLAEIEAVSPAERYQLTVNCAAPGDPDNFTAASVTMSGGYAMQGGISSPQYEAQRDHLRGILEGFIQNAERHRPPVVRVLATVQMALLVALCVLLSFSWLNVTSRTWPALTLLTAVAVGLYVVAAVKIHRLRNTQWAQRWDSSRLRLVTRAIAENERRDARKNFKVAALTALVFAPIGALIGALITALAT